jgi:hypothetical protein
VPQPAEQPAHLGLHIVLGHLRPQAGMQSAADYFAAMQDVGHGIQPGPHGVWKYVTKGSYALLQDIFVTGPKWYQPDGREL